LLIEDAPADAALILRELRGAGVRCETQRVETAAALRAALAEFAPDVVLADHTLAGFGASDALRIVRAERPGTPVIIVTGSLDEETAAEYILAGAVDYVVKDRLFRLPAAVRRAFALQRAEAEAAQLEEQHRQSQKMAAIGRLASGVAHDVNNVLMSIMGSADLILMDAKEGDPIHAETSEIKISVQRGASLTRQLLAFSRRQATVTKVFMLRDATSSMETMLRRLIGPEIDLQILRSSDVMVKADPAQMEQVILNLCVNARDAMPQGGRLSVNVEEVELNEWAAGLIGEEAKPFSGKLATIHPEGQGR